MVFPLFFAGRFHKTRSKWAFDGLGVVYFSARNPPRAGGVFLYWGRLLNAYTLTQCPETCAGAWCELFFSFQSTTCVQSAQNLKLLGLSWSCFAFKAFWKSLCTQTCRSIAANGHIHHHLGYQTQTHPKGLLKVTFVKSVTLSIILSG